MKKCSRCSAENFEDQKFCNLCGRELTARIALDLYAGNAPKPTPPTVEEPLTPEAAAYQHFVRAKDEIAQRNLDGAIAEFKKALAACPGDPMIERLLKKTEEARDRAQVPPRPAEPPRAPRTLSAGPRPGASIAPNSAPPRAHASLVGDPASPVAQPPRPRSSVPLTHDVSASAAIDDVDAMPPLRRGGMHPGVNDTPAKAPARRAPAPQASIPSAARVSPKAAPVHQASVTRGFKGKATEAESAGTRVAPHTGRFLELYERAPTLSPALALDGRGDESVREIAVNLLILGGFLMFGFLLLL